MKTIAVIDLRNLSAYAENSWLTYTNTLAAVKSKLGFCSEIYTLGYHAAQIIIEKNASIISIVQQLSTISQENDLIIYADAAAPFVDEALLGEMINISQRYHVEYHFAEGYPRGFACQILKAAILPQLLELAKQQPDLDSYADNFFFALMKIKLNDFDIETALAPVDLRQLRLELLYNNKNNATICQNIMSKGITDLKSLLSQHDNLEKLAIGLPAYYNLQISANCPQRCSYCPYPNLASFNDDRFIDLTKLELLLAKIVQFSGEAVIGLSLLGEPALHPNIDKIIELVLSFPTLKLHIETSGIGWSEQALAKLKQQEPTRLSIIVSLDSLDASEYAQVRGEGFDQAMQFIEHLHSDALWQKRLWVQRVRTKSMEDGLQKFYQQAKTANYQLIIQQYHTYANTLPIGIELDLSPIKRGGCWALKREMSIYLDGSVHLCRVDITAKHKMGNAYEEELQIIWQRIQEIHQQHLAQNYPSICQNCEEYYIYTF